MEEKNVYLEAAKIVAECKPSKLPYVLAILREGGIEIEKIPKLPKKSELKPGKEQEVVRSEKRKGLDRSEWREAEDPTLLALRDAFDSGLNISRFSNASKIYRTAIYKYLSGEQPISEYTRKRIENGLSSLGFKTSIER